MKENLILKQVPVHTVGREWLHHANSSFISLVNFQFFHSQVMHFASNVLAHLLQPNRGSFSKLTVTEKLYLVWMFSWEVGCVSLLNKYINIPSKNIIEDVTTVLATFRLHVLCSHPISVLGLLPKTTFFLIYRVFTTKDIMHWELPILLVQSGDYFAFLSYQHSIMETKNCPRALFLCMTG